VVGLRRNILSKTEKIKTPTGKILVRNLRRARRKALKNLASPRQEINR